MKLLKEIRDKDIDPGNAWGLRDGYVTRHAARAVVFDDEGRIALLYVTRKGHHKIPGGGIEPGEDVLVALRREIAEEIGCTIEVFDEVGEIHEYRGEFNQLQKSYCYLARIVGEKGNPELTQEEIDDGYTVLWKTVEEAIDLFRSDSPLEHVGKFMSLRDLTFILETRSL